MRRAARLLLLPACLGFVLAGCERGGPPVQPGRSFRASLQADSAGLGDPVVLTLSAVLPSASKALLPGDGDSLGAWRILARGPVTSRRGGAWTRHERELTIAAYRLGAVGPDTLVAWGVGPAGDSTRLAYAPPRLRIMGKMKEGEAVDPSSARDIRDVVSTGPAAWPWILGGGVLAAAGLFLLWRWLRSRRKKGFEAPVPSGPTAEEEFERAIERLLSSGLLEQGLYREFYYGVSSAVRLYLERVHGLPLLESTSTEVLDLLEPRIPGTGERQSLRDWLIEGDLVKYARMERLQAEARNYLDRSLNLVRQLAKGREASPGVDGSAPAAVPPDGAAGAPAAGRGGS